MTEQQQQYKLEQRIDNAKLTLKRFTKKGLIQLVISQMINEENIYKDIFERIEKHIKE